MTKLKDILHGVIISNQTGADYSSLNTAIAGMGTVKTFMIKSAVTLTNNITLPSDCIIVIGSQGSLSGAYTLTGSGTVLIFESEHTCFNANVIFAGTWICDVVKPELWGAVGNGVTDDSVSISKAVTFCKLTTSKRLTFNQKTYRCNTGVDVSGLNVVGNNALIIAASGTPFVATGSIGTFYKLTGNAYVGDNWLKCTNATLLASLANGDLVKVVSNEIIQPDSGENVRVGEIHEVHSVDAVNGYVYFNDYLFYHYKLTDTARVAKITPANLVIRDLKCKVEATGGNLAFNLTGIKDLLLDNVIAQASRIGIGIYDCYRPKVKVNTFQTDEEGYGYGIGIGGATMYAKVEGIFVGGRHCVTTGGGGLGNGDNMGGVSWETIVSNSIGTSGLAAATIFDTHASTGSIHYNNCIAVGGIFKTYVTSISDWDNESTLIADSLVRSTLETLYKAIQENTNVDPDSDAGVNWAQDWPGEDQSAFKAEGLNCHYTNCKVIGCAYGIRITGTKMINITIKNLETTDVKYPLFAYYTHTLENLHVDGINSVNKSSGLVIRLAGIIARWSFSNIHAKNLLLCALESTTSIFPDRFSINNFSVIFESAKANSGYAINNTIANNKQIELRNGDIVGCNLLKCLNQVTLDNTELIVLKDIYCDAPTSDLIKIEHIVDNVMIDGVHSRNPVAENYFISLSRNTQNLSIVNSSYLGANAKKLIYTDGAASLTNLLHIGNVFPNLTAAKTGTGASAAEEVMSGSIGWI